MPQVRKAEVDGRIRAAALQRFAEDGYDRTSMASIASTAQVATANLYRYHPGGKRELFDAVVTADLAGHLDELVAKRVHALMLPGAPQQEQQEPSPEAEELLAFWIAHRLEVVILLDRAEGTPFAAYPQRFVQHLVELAEVRLQHAGVRPGETERHLLEVVMSNTRLALAQILLRCTTDAAIRRAVEGFWSYQLPGLDGLYRWLCQIRG